MNDPVWLIKQDSATVADRVQLLADLLVAQVVEHLPTEQMRPQVLKSIAPQRRELPCEDSAAGPGGTPALDIGRKLVVLRDSRCIRAPASIA